MLGPLTSPLPTATDDNRRRDAAGRASLPLDQTEGHVPDPWHANLILPCVVPLSVGEAAAGGAKVRARPRRSARSPVCCCGGFSPES